MEKLFTGGITPLLVLAGIVVIVTVGVMSILLPILVFRMLSELSKINHKMNTVITALNEMAKVTKEQARQPRPDDARLGSPPSERSGPMDIGEKSIRFK